MHKGRQAETEASMRVGLNRDHLDEAIITVANEDASSHT